MTDNFANFIVFFPLVLISVALHEFAHCWTTDRLGDDTPRLAGRVTLNPLAHLDMIGTVMIVLSSFAGVGIGWGRAAQFNPINFRHPARDRMITALAGPFSNVLQILAWGSLAVVLLSCYPADPTMQQKMLFDTLGQVCYLGMAVNAGLAVFNLLPMYPLDGHHIVSYFVPHSWRSVVDNPNWGYLFLALVLIGPVRDLVLHPYMTFARSTAMTVASYVIGIQFE